MGAEGEIREALTNLVFNAVDAMPDGGTLTIRTRSVTLPPSEGELGGHRQVHVEVIDSGLGMDEEARRRCLEPFFTTKGERGTGLGLAMVYGMAQRHSADIQIESQLGEGTIVRLTFSAPVTIEVLPDGTTTSIEPPQLRLLIVDDDPMLLKSLRNILESDGHLVVAVNGGQVGIETFQKALSGSEPFEVVITDLGMPYVDGRQVASSVKQVAPATPVVMLTGWGQRLVTEGDVPPDVDLVLSKPPRIRELREALMRCVELAQLESRLPR
jgi:CheY-like chemotaxis protein